MPTGAGILAGVFLVIFSFSIYLPRHLKDFSAVLPRKLNLDTLHPWKDF
ncbi:hypothetical protein SD77_0844 [Bacillus badius]|uniref:Uncharacterized protein n=1 Tax=Bacillus badius TaxID=1455 RepID=A0ABR5AVL0_BACBA|nr:hypothetical protein SD78_3906 [Bacillus badius]KIL78243.1 hypothetical protein SD77_0844 [Bacillus badius]